MKKGLLLVLGIIFVCSQITWSQTTRKEISLKDIWTTHTLFPKTVRGIVSLNNGKQYTEIKNGSIVVYDYRTGDSLSTLVNGKDLIPKGGKSPIHIGNFSVNLKGND